MSTSLGPADPMMSTLVQTRIPPQEQGRVYGVQMSAFYAVPPIAMLIIGGAVEQFGLALGVPGTGRPACGVLHRGDALAGHQRTGQMSASASGVPASSLAGSHGDRVPLWDLGAKKISMPR